MKNYFYLFLLSLTSFSSFAQNEEAILKQIDDQVWKPFMETFGQSDQTGFQSIHSKDVARVSIDDGSIINFNQYFKALPDSIKTKYNM